MEGRTRKKQITKYKDTRTRSIGKEHPMPSFYIPFSIESAKWKPAKRKDHAGAGAEQSPTRHPTAQHGIRPRTTQQRAPEERRPNSPRTTAPAPYTTLHSRRITACRGSRGSTTGARPSTLPSTLPHDVHRQKHAQTHLRMHYHRRPGSLRQLLQSGTHSTATGARTSKPPALTSARGKKKIDAAGPGRHFA